MNQNTLFNGENITLSHSFIDHLGFNSFGINNSIIIRQTYPLKFYNTLQCNTDIPMIEQTQMITIVDTFVNTFEITPMTTLEITPMTTLGISPMTTLEITPMNTLDITLKRTPQITPNNTSDESRNVSPITYILSTLSVIGLLIVSTIALGMIFQKNQPSSSCSEQVPYKI